MNVLKDQELCLEMIRLENWAVGGVEKAPDTSVATWGWFLAGGKSPLVVQSWRGRDSDPQAESGWWASDFLLWVEGLSSSLLTLQLHTISSKLPPTVGSWEGGLFSTKYTI